MHHLDMAGTSFFCSWSGGKDAYLALHRAVRAGGRPEALLCMAAEDGERSRGHGVPMPVLAQQAAVLGVPLVWRATTWDDYEATYIAALRELREQGMQAGVFGDIDLQPHRDWVENVCKVAGLDCRLPLWQEPRQVLIDELLGLGVQATVVALVAERLDRRFLGCRLTRDLVAELVAEGVDACGENGEYHTLVTDAPLFSSRLELRWSGETLRGEGWYLNISASDTKIKTQAVAGAQGKASGHDSKEDKE